MTNGIPFDVKIPNARTLKAMKEAQAGNARRFMKRGTHSELFSK